MLGKVSDVPTVTQLMSVGQSQCPGLTPESPLLPALATDSLILRGSGHLNSCVAHVGKPTDDQRGAGPGGQQQALGQSGLLDPHPGLRSLPSDTKEHWQKHNF